MFVAHEWADWVRTLKSDELFARDVMPHVQGSFDGIGRSHDDAVEEVEPIKQAGTRAIEAAHQAYEQRRARRIGRPV